MCIESITTYTLNYKINVLSIPPLKEWAFRTFVVNFIREFHSVTHGFFMLPWKENQMNFFTVSTMPTGTHMAKHLPSILP